MADPETIHNWRRLDDRITTSGQPTEPQLADIHALGVRHIINLGLHTHEKALPDEAASVSRLGMTYIHIPVDFQNPTDKPRPYTLGVPNLFHIGTRLDFIHTKDIATITIEEG